MLTTRFVFFGFALLSTRSASSELTKCCPRGNIYFGSSEVFCIDEEGTKMYFAYPNNTRPGLYRGRLQCVKLEDIVTTALDDFVADEHQEIPACFDILHDPKTGLNASTVVIQCRSNTNRQVNESSPQITYIRKCCPHDTIFDRRTKACVSQLNSAPSLLSNETVDEDSVMIISEGPPKCEGPIVDYEIDDYDASLWNGTYSAMIPISNHDSIVKEEYFVTKDNACFDMKPHSASNRSMIVRVCRDQKYCDRNACIRKCCAEDELFYAPYCRKRVTEEVAEFHSAFARAVNATQSSTFDTTKDYGVLIGKPCLYGMYPVNPTKEKWSMTSQGHVKVENYPIYNLDQYCMDVYYNKSHYNRGFYLFICFEKDGPVQNIKTSYKVNTVLEFTSCTFLLITLLVYVCLPNLQNLHGKTLMCHVSSLFLAFTCLAVIPWITPGVASNIKEPKVTAICKVLGYTMLFCFLSAFSWLNVICFDIWWTFGGLRGDTITKGRKHRRRFLLYCLYAWGFSLLVSILAIIFDYTESLPMYLRPNVGYTSCWFAQLPGLYGEMTFFVGPVTIQLISNVVFFVLTSMHCNQVKAEIKRVTSDPADPRSKRFHSDRNRLIMNIKLFIIMGMSWICEVMSFFLKRYNVEWQDAIFYVSDVFNCLQGLLIFILFVLKSRVYLALRRRLGLDVGKKRACNNTTTLQDPYRVRKSVSNSTIMSTFAVSSAP